MTVKPLKALDWLCHGLVPAALVYGTHAGKPGVVALAVTGLWWAKVIEGISLLILGCVAAKASSMGASLRHLVDERLGKPADASGLFWLAAYLSALSYANEITLAGMVLAVFSAHYVLYCTFDDNKDPS